MSKSKAKGDEVVEKEQYTAMVRESVDGFIAVVTQNSDNEIVYQQKFKDPEVAKNVAMREKDLRENK